MYRCLQGKCLSKRYEFENLQVDAKTDTGKIVMTKRTGFKRIEEEKKEEGLGMEEMKDEIDYVHMEQELFDQEFGFSRIVEMLIESKLPLIGHNCMYDICFLFRQFIAPLPETWGEFK